MKVILFLFIGFNIFSQNLDFIDEYHCSNTKEKELLFIKKYKKSTDISVIPYLISFEMKQAEYTIFPWKKLSIFNKGKKSLEKYIKLYPNNIHFRYIRLLIQQNTPKILGYRKSIEKDKEFINNYLVKNKEDSVLNKYIKKNIVL